MAFCSAYGTYGLGLGLQGAGPGQYGQDRGNLGQIGAMASGPGGGMSMYLMAPDRGAGTGQTPGSHYLHHGYHHHPLNVNQLRSYSSMQSIV